MIILEVKTGYFTQKAQVAAASLQWNGSYEGYQHHTWIQQGSLNPRESQLSRHPKIYSNTLDENNTLIHAKGAWFFPKLHGISIKSACVCVKRRLVGPIFIQMWDNVYVSISIAKILPHLGAFGVLGLNVRSSSFIWRQCLHCGFKTQPALYLKDSNIMASGRAFEYFLFDFVNPKINWNKV